MIGMARKSVASEKAAKRPSKIASDASLPLQAPVLSIVAGLEGHDLDGLRHRGTPIGRRASSAGEHQLWKRKFAA